MICGRDDGEWKKMQFVILQSDPASIQCRYFFMIATIDCLIRLDNIVHRKKNWLTGEWESCAINHFGNLEEFQDCAIRSTLIIVVVNLRVQGMVKLYCSMFARRFRALLATRRGAQWTQTPRDGKVASRDSYTLGYQRMQNPRIQEQFHGRTFAACPAKKLLTRHFCVRPPWRSAKLHSSSSVASAQLAPDNSTQQLKAECGAIS